MVSVLASSAIYCGFEPRSGQTKYYEISSCCIFAKHTLLTIVCQSGATCLSTDWRFSVKALTKNPTKHVNLLQSGTHHFLIAN
jgi:hypothetical protein